MKVSSHQGRHALTIRPPAELHEALTEAAAYLGVSLNSLVLQASADRVKEILARQREIKLSRQAADSFFEALENPPAPNAALEKSAAAYRDLILE